MKKRESISKIKLSDVQKEKLNAEIKAFYIAERGEEIGMIELIQLLDLFLTFCGFDTRSYSGSVRTFPRFPVVYNLRKSKGK
ncbi:DUF2164 family protein [Lachnospiraceae bacterium MD308]|nr:DUF2164 family protein [Lachnospiraceae bacterium MD308]